MSRIRSILLLVFLTIMLPIEGLCQCTGPVFNGGSGTSGSPFLISTCQQLSNMRHCDGNTFDNTHFLIQNNIDCSGLTPFPQMDIAFYGTLDGGGHTISNVALLTNEFDAGIFRVARNAAFRNLVLDNISVTNGTAPGGGGLLVDYLGPDPSDLQISYLENITVKNSSLTTSANVGGLVGLVVDAQVSNLLAENITVTATREGGEAGALFGLSRDTSGVGLTVRDSDVTGGTHSGGIIGRIESRDEPVHILSDLEVTNTIVQGQVFDEELMMVVPTDNIGGAFGSVQGITIQDIAVTGGSVDGQNQVGGVVGLYEIGFQEGVDKGSLSDVRMNNTQISGQMHVGGIVGEAWVDVREAISETPHTITGTEGVGGVAGFLQGTLSADVLVTISGTTGLGGMVGITRIAEISALTPYRTQLATVTGGFYAGGIVGHTLHDTLIRDLIVESDVSITNIYAGGLVGGSEFVNVAEFYPARVNRVIVQNSTIQGDHSLGGLIGIQEGHAPGTFPVDHAIVRNTTITSNATLSNSSRIGGIVGSGFRFSGRNLLVESSTIENGNPAATTGFNCAGILAFDQQSPSAIQNATVADVDISCRGDVGGLIGQLASIHTLENSAAAARFDTAHAGTSIGGLIGYSFGQSITVRDSYANFDLVSPNPSDYCGGAIGLLSPGSVGPNVIDGAYASGSIDSCDDYVGGLVGYANHFAISNSESRVDITNAGSFAGGLAGVVSHPFLNNRPANTIDNSHSFGRVFGSGTRGGFIGFDTEDDNTEGQATPVAITNSTYAVPLAGSATGCIGNSLDAPGCTEQASPLIEVTAPLHEAVFTDSTVVLTGTASPSETLTILDRGSVIGTAKVGTGGQWSFSSPALLIAGGHVVMVRGTSSAPSPVISFVVNYSGTSVTSLTPDTLITNATPEICGYAAPFSVLEVVVDTQTLEVTTDMHGSFCVTPQNALSPAIYSINVSTKEGPAGSTAVNLTGIEIGSPSSLGIEGTARTIMEGESVLFEGHAPPILICNTQ